MAVEMFSEERQEAILQLLKRENKLTVQRICEEFNVSPATVRNDLNDMARKDLLIRTHGGAMLRQRVGIELTNQQKQIKNVEEKKRIAREALTMINDGDTLAIDTGTTTMIFSETLTAKKNLTILTNDLKIALMLEENTNFTVIVIGGILRKRYSCALGPMSIAGLKSFRVDKAFLGANGITADAGFTTPNIYHAEYKRTLVEISNETIVLSTGNKLGVNSFTTFAHAKDIHTIITDTSAPSSEVTALRNMDVDIRMV